jgi:Family of unknown function (DUF5681)
MPWIKGVSGNPLGRLPSEKKYTEALRMVSKEEVEHPRDQTRKVQKLRLMAEIVFERALAGESWAVQHISDRLEGKPAQMLVDLPAPSGGTLERRKLTYEIVHVTRAEIDDRDHDRELELEAIEGNGHDQAESDKAVNGDAANAAPSAANSAPREPNGSPEASREATVENVEQNSDDEAVNGDGHEQRE